MPQFQTFGLESLLFKHVLQCMLQFRAAFKLKRLFLLLQCLINSERSGLNLQYKDSYSPIFTAEPRGGVLLRRVCGGHLFFFTIPHPCLIPPFSPDNLEILFAVSKSVYECRNLAQQVAW